MNGPVKLEAVFFKTASGKEPVREWLLGLTKDQRKAVGIDVRTVQYGWPIGMPLIRKIDSGLWEVRTRFESGIARVFFTVDRDVVVLLHGFVKKSQKTSENDLKTARARLKQYLEE